MDSIEIEITALGYLETIYIDVKNKKVYLKNVCKDISESQIDELLRIIRTWDNEYIGNIIDSEKFLIKVNTNRGTNIIKGNGGYPKNYSAFKGWIGDLYD